MLPTATHQTPTRWSPRIVGATPPTPVPVLRRHPTIAPMLTADPVLDRQVLSDAADGLRGGSGHDRDAVRTQLHAFAAQRDRSGTIRHVRRGAIVRGTAPLGAVAFICEPTCPTPVVTEHIIAAVTAGNIVAVALLETADPLLNGLLEDLATALPTSFVVVQTATGNDWTCVPDDCTVVVLTRSRIHFDGTGSYLVPATPATDRSRKAIYGMYRRSTRYTVGIDIAPRSAGSLTGGAGA